MVLRDGPPCPHCVALMKTTVSRVYVVAQHPDNPNRFWSRREQDGNAMRPVSDDPDGFGTIHQAQLSDPRYCHDATDMTWHPGLHRTNPDFTSLAHCKLVPVRVTTIYEVTE